MIKAIIFDFDGVIHDTWDLVYGINKQIYPGLTVEKYRNLFDGNIYSNKRITKTAADKFFIKQDEAFQHLRVESRVYSELDSLSRDYSLFIITSNKESTIIDYMKNNNMTNTFKKIYGLETDKSKINKFNRLLEEHNLKNEECVFVTDTLGDIREANKIPIKTIAVDYGFHERERLKLGKPLSIVSEFSSIRTEIEKLV